MDVRLHPGLHVMANLDGKTVGGVFCEPGSAVPGVVVGHSESGITVTVKLDSPIGAGEPHGLLKRPSRGQDLVSLELDRVQPVDDAVAIPGGVPAEIVELWHAGKELQAIKKYRALNGATMDEARAALRNL
jgi:hypothetical protein